jgi:hypothetical protein
MDFDPGSKKKLIPDPGIKKESDPGSESAKLFVLFLKVNFCSVLQIKVNSSMVSYSQLPLCLSYVNLYGSVATVTEPCMRSTYQYLSTLLCL